MQCGPLTVGTAPVKVPFRMKATYGLKLLARQANAGNVFMGTTNGVTTGTGSLVSKGTPATAFPTVVPPDHVNTPNPPGQTPLRNEVWLIADAEGQVIDWYYQ